jgi:hypothetical protein
MLLQDILLDILSRSSTIPISAQKKALRNYRQRLESRGMARFEVLGRDHDRELIRAVARRLSRDDPDARRIRATLERTLAGATPPQGGILAALRRSPLVGEDLDLGRSVNHGRQVDL